MSNKNPFDLSPSVNRLKKLPPPPLCLPASNTTTDEEKLSKSDQSTEQNKSTINCNLSSSSKECLHDEIPYVSGEKKYFFYMKKFYSDRYFQWVNVLKFLKH